MNSFSECQCMCHIAGLFNAKHIVACCDQSGKKKNGVNYE